MSFLVACKAKERSVIFSPVPIRDSMESERSQRTNGTALAVIAHHPRFMAQGAYGGRKPRKSPFGSASLLDSRAAGRLERVSYIRASSGGRGIHRENLSGHCRRGPGILALPALGPAAATFRGQF